MIRDGSSENANALGVYCGVKRPSEVTSSGNQLWVQFTSTEEAEGKGFLMSYDTGNEMNPQPYSKCDFAPPKCINGVLANLMLGVTL